MARRWRFTPKPLIEMRRQLGLSPSAFARRMRPPMSGNQIVNVEQRRQTLTVESLLNICLNYDIHPSEFFVERAAKK